MKTLMCCVAVLMAAPLAWAQPGEAGWTTLFDGRSLDGWTVSEHPASVTVRDGYIACHGSRAHVFYTGAPARFEDFELEAAIRTRPGSNGGLYFHTAYQDSGWPSQGYEVQINNTYDPPGPGRELRKTGSLYNVRDVYKALAPDDAWFRLAVRVRGAHVQVWVDTTLAVDYTAPEPFPGGTFALQCHDAGSEVHFKDLRVRPLPEAAAAAAPVPAGDTTYALRQALRARGFPIADLHVHLKGGLTLEDALEKSRRDGIFYGIAPNCGLGFPITDDAGIYAFVDSMRGQPVFLGMQAEGREWRTLFSEEAIAQFDYVFTDALTFTDDQGRRTRLWLPDEVEVGDPQAFMDMYVDRILSVLNEEPIDVFVNPTFLPAVIAGQYDALWTEARMRRVIDAAVRNGIAIEINNRYRLPSVAFVRRAKEAGATFSCGTNNADRQLGRIDYCLEVIQAAELEPGDFFVPDSDGRAAGSGSG